MNKQFIEDANKGLATLIDTFAKLLGDQFEGLGPGNTYMTDSDFVRWFEWQVKQRPNFIQMLMMPGVEGGRSYVLRYAKLTGAENIIPILTKMFAGKGV